MLRKLLTVTTVVLAGWAATTGVAAAAPTLSPPTAVAAPTPIAVATPTPVPTPAPTCPPALPISGRVTGATATSLTITYAIVLSPPCGFDPPVTVTLFAGRDDAMRWQNPVAEATSGPERNGTVTIERLTPDTEYWYRFSDDNDLPDPYVIGGAARTLPLAACRATATVDSRWGGGYVATVTVRNTGVEPLDRWHVSWRWAGDERIQAIWGGLADTEGADVTVGNASYNGTLAPDAVTTFGMLVATSTAPAELTLTCGR
ncbi:cellulose binding domain-containing protein [Micromonospora profundi]|uniref:cellulose binding domain-containing protein n=1 Tax=Micromonospora sp. NRRL B-16802 TaxID=1415541 RepID=UPI0006AFE7BE|nr:cellulose binding domain-containing protein [Micromonospora sp. NRRL B-16802]KOX08076.1 endoglucanase [Micromonospora sp. NRRL B-16802]